MNHPPGDPVSPDEYESEDPYDDVDDYDEFLDADGFDLDEGGGEGDWVAQDDDFACAEEDEDFDAA